MSEYEGLKHHTFLSYSMNSNFKTYFFFNGIISSMEIVLLKNLKLLL